MTLRLVRFAAAFAAVVAVAGCETPPPRQPIPQLTFSHLQPYNLSVGRVEVVSEYQSPNREPHVDQLMPLPLEAAVKNWVQQRLRPMGTTGAVRVTIKDASVVEVPLQTDRSVLGFFKQEQSEQYDANLQLLIQVLDDRNMPQAEIMTRTARSRTIAEGTTLNERDRIWFQMVEEMMQDMNRQIEGLIPQYLGAYVMR